MKAWYLCEWSYPFVPQEVLEGAAPVRASLPNHHVDPRHAADLFHKVPDVFLLRDEPGSDVISNEHHAGINCLLGATPLLLGALAHQINAFRARVGGFANLVLIGRSGFMGHAHAGKRCDLGDFMALRLMDHAQAEKGLRPFVRAVLPRLQDPVLASAA